MHKNYIKDFLIVLGISIIYQLIFSTSVYLNVFSQDSSVFQVMGLSILDGHVPYVDIFDHKGIILYWLNALGLWLLPHGLGLLVLCIISFAVSLFLWLKTSTLFLSNWKRWMPLLFGVLLCAITDADGNMTEMWSLPPISYAVYLLAKNIKYHNTNKRYENLILGIGMGLVLFIRPNNIIPIGWYCIIYVLLAIFSGEFKRGLVDSLAMAAGFFSSLVVIIGAFYLCYRNLDPLFYGTFLFNMKYADSIGGAFQLQQLLAPYLILFTSLLGLFILFHLFTKAFHQKKNQFANNHATILLLCYVIGAYLIVVFTMSKAYVNHYFVVIIPLMVILSIKAIDYCKEKILSVGTKVCMALFLLGGFFVYYKYPSITDKINKRFVYSQQMKSLDDFVASIPQDEKNDIWNYNGRFMCINALFHNGIIQRNRIILPFQMRVDSDLKEIGIIQDVEPKWIVINPSKPWISPEDEEFIQLCYTKTFVSNVKTEDDIVFYRHK